MIISILVKTFKCKELDDYNYYKIMNHKCHLLHDQVISIVKIKLNSYQGEETDRFSSAK